MTGVLTYLRYLWFDNLHENIESVLLTWYGLMKIYQCALCSDACVEFDDTD